MVGDDAFGRGPGRAFLMRRAADLVELGEDRGEELGLVAVVLALQDRGHAFEAHARIDVLLRQRGERAVRLLEILHEDVVPDLDPALVGGIEDFRRGLRAGPVEEFGIGSAGAGDAGGSPPVVLFRKLGDALLAHAVVAPFVVGFLVERGVLVAREHGESEHFERESEVVGRGQEFVAERDRLFLEVVAEGPVAQHLEEREVHGVAHVVDVARADALLDVGEAGPLRMLLAEEIRHQRVHPGGGEEHGRVIVRHEGGAADDRVSLGLEELQVLFAKLSGCGNHVMVISM